MACFCSGPGYRCSDDCKTYVLEKCSTILKILAAFGRRSISVVHSWRHFENCINFFSELDCKENYSIHLRTENEYVTRGQLTKSSVAKHYILFNNWSDAKTNRCIRYKTRSKLLINTALGVTSSNERQKIRKSRKMYLRFKNYF